MHGCPLHGSTFLVISGGVQLHTRHRLRSPHVVVPQPGSQSKGSLLSIATPRVRYDTHLAKNDTPPKPIDDSIPEDPSSSSSLAYLGPGGPALVNVLLDHLTPAGVEGQRLKWSLPPLLTDTAN